MKLITFQSFLGGFCCLFGCQCCVCRAWTGAEDLGKHQEPPVKTPDGNRETHFGSSGSTFPWLCHPCVSVAQCTGMSRDLEAGSCRRAQPVTFLTKHISWRDLFSLPSLHIFSFSSSSALSGRPSVWYSQDK